jgi:hypothetical protein
MAWCTMKPNAMLRCAGELGRKANLLVFSSGGAGRHDLPRAIFFSPPQQIRDPDL